MAESGASNMKIHVVRSGDTVWRIARKYKIESAQIVYVNDLENPARLVVGQALIIPEPYLRYIVQPGDSLGIICMIYGVDIQEILQLNRMADPASIYPGQTLLIPVLYHTVAVGESLFLIASRYGTTVQEIIQTNQLNVPSRLFAGQVLKIPKAVKPVVEVNAFTYILGQKSTGGIRETASNLTYVSPASYRIKEDGSLENIEDAQITQAAFLNKVVPVMAIAGFTHTENKTSPAHKICSNPVLLEKLLNAIIEKMKKRGYRGLNINFENAAPEDRQFYNWFLQKAIKRLHEENLFVSSSVILKASGEEKSLPIEVQDYEAHGHMLDFIVLKTSNREHKKSPPQAISPLNHLRSVLDYAVTIIPRNKIMLGFQTYARDWIVPYQKGQEAEIFDVQEALRRAGRYEAEIKYDQVSQASYYHYIDEKGLSHEVWFEDARSTKAKFDLVKIYHLRGLSYESLDFLFPQNWEMLSDTFLIRKF